jgi:uncharacterized protein
VNAKKALVHDHISHGVQESLKSPVRAVEAALKEFEAIAKYF